MTEQTPRKKATRKKTATKPQLPRKCSNCFYGEDHPRNHTLHPHNHMVLCMRFPKEETKGTQAWCGEFKPK